MTEQNDIRLKNKLWTERYRPNNLSEVVGHEQIIIRLQAFVKARNSLEFLFSGPPASGKTTTAIAFARELFGDNWERNFTELNASDERGIDVVRNKIKDFAGTSPVNAPFKIIFLDEVDELCLPEGTFVLTGSGTGQRFEKIENVPQDRYVAMQSVNLDTGEIEKDKGICVDSGTAEFYKITLSNGKTVTASEKHPFFTQNLSEIWMRDINPGTKILDFASDLGLNECEVCGETTANDRYCSIKCKNEGHSMNMSGDGNPMQGKESWAKGLTKADSQKINQGTFGDDNPSKRPEVREKIRQSNIDRWNNMSDEERNGIFKKISDAKKGMNYDTLFGENADKERVKRSIYAPEDFKNTGYRKRMLKDLDSVSCECCGAKTKTSGNDGIYIHHEDGNHSNNAPENLKMACPRCHNMEIHNHAEDWMHKGWAITHSSRVCADGINCPDLVEIIKKEYIGSGKAYNITMKKNPCFFLHNGILTHNTKPAQSALRRTIEKYSNTCRFVLSCNYDNKLIAPIRSRLMSFHFAGLKDDDMKTLAYRVIRAENLTMPDEAVDLLVELSDRDTRTVLNTLQVCALLGNDITLETVKNTLQVPDKKQVKQMIESAISGDLDLAFEIGGNHIINSGFDVGKILRMIDKNLAYLDLHKNTKCALLDIISDTEDRINHGGTPDIQLRGLLSKFALATSVPPECPAIQSH